MRNKDPVPVNSSLSFSPSISWNGLSIPPSTLLARCRENVDMLEAAAADGGRTKEQQVSRPTRRAARTAKHCQPLALRLVQEP